MIGLAFAGVLAVGQALANSDAPEFEPQPIEVCYNATNGTIRTFSDEPIECRNNELKLELASFEDLLQLNKVLESEVSRLEQEFDRKLSDLEKKLKGLLQDERDQRIRHDRVLAGLIEDESQAREDAVANLQGQIGDMADDILKIKTDVGNLIASLTTALDTDETSACDGLEGPALKLCHFKLETTKTKQEHKEQLDKQALFEKSIKEGLGEDEELSDEELKQKMKEQRLLKDAFKKVIEEDENTDPHKSFDEQVEAKLKKIAEQEKKLNEKEQKLTEQEDEIKRQGEKQQQYEKYKDALKEGVKETEEEELSDEDAAKRIEEKLKQISEQEKKLGDHEARLTNAEDAIEDLDSDVYRLDRRIDQQGDTIAQHSGRIGEIESSMSALVAVLLEAQQSFDRLANQEQVPTLSDVLTLMTETLANLHGALAEGDD